MILKMESPLNQARFYIISRYAAYHMPAGVQMFGFAYRKINIKHKKVARVKGKICFGTKDNAVGVLNEKANTIDTVVLGFGH